MQVKIGTCGYGYLPEKGDKLLNYVKIFPIVEINYTFYRIPRLSTAIKWRKKADSLNKDFEFVVKAYKGITHIDKFSKKSYEYFEKMQEIAKALRAKVILFQTPASFKPTKQNIKKAEDFFSTIERTFLIAWEVRWNNWTDEIVEYLFNKLKLVHALDPLRREPLFKDFCYFRLHGFGGPMIYNYKFSDKEIRKVIDYAVQCSRAYVFFNNFNMYEDAKRAIDYLNSSI